MADEERTGMQDADEGDAFEARLKALTEYRELVERQRRGAVLPGDQARRMELQPVLERSGGIPRALVWHRFGGEG